MSNRTKMIMIAALLATMLNGCTTTEVAEAEANSRYKVESVKDTGFYITIVHVITDTETGQRWMVCANTNGGTAIESMDDGSQS